MDMTVDQEKAHLLSKYADEVAEFRRFCIEHGDERGFRETDFTDLSLGFFIAKGVTGRGEGMIDEPEDFYEARRLATITRYDLQYWEGETL